MPTRIKVCGITRLEDALGAIELGASALGFTFYRHSPRYIRPTAAREIIGQLPPFVVAVGVFADETDAKHVAAIGREARITAIQLHGPKVPVVNGLLGQYFVIRAVAVQQGFKREDLSRLKANAFLLDTFDPHLRGGTGRTFDWNLARDTKPFGPIILAGGLTPENVGEAIRAGRPFAVDVASGAESSPGIKDPAKLRAFFAAVREADERLQTED